MAVRLMAPLKLSLGITCPEGRSTLFLHVQSSLARSHRVLAVLHGLRLATGQGTAQLKGASVGLVWVSFPLGCCLLCFN